MAFVFWTREDVGFNFLSLITDSEPSQVRDLIDSTRTGKYDPHIDPISFYATSLSGSGGRAVVRDWLDTTVGEVKHHLATWFQRQKIVDTSGQEGRPLGLYSLAYATVREAKDLPTPTPRILLRSALTGAPLPRDTLYQVVRRIRAQSERRGERVQQKITHPQAALIKLVLLSQQLNYEEDYMVQLDPGNTNPAYLCGRLLAVLEKAQRDAIGNINATIVDRFYGTASSAPASVFSRLLRGAQPHLAKLKRDKPGAHYAIQSRLEEIMSRIPGDKGFPRTLTLEEQGLFSLGYYHQRAHDRAQAREAAERRRRGLPVEPDADLPQDDSDAMDESTNENQKEE